MTSSSQRRFMHLACGNHALRCPRVPGEVCTVVPASGSRSSVQDHDSPALSKRSACRAGGPAAPSSDRMKGHQSRSQVGTPVTGICRTVIATESGRLAGLANGYSRAPIRDWAQRAWQHGRYHAEEPVLSVGPWADAVSPADGARRGDDPGRPRSGCHVIACYTFLRVIAEGIWDG
jgi:hypothetical protein